MFKVRLVPTNLRGYRNAASNNRKIRTLASCHDATECDKMRDFEAMLVQGQLNEKPKSLRNLRRVSKHKEDLAKQFTSRFSVKVTVCPVSGKAVSYCVYE